MLLERTTFFACAQAKKKKKTKIDTGAARFHNCPGKPSVDHSSPKSVNDPKLLWLQPQTTTGGCHEPETV